MNLIAIKMLVGDRAKYLGIIVGLTFASLLITQQAAIFVGLMTRTYGAVSANGLADIWIMDENVRFFDDVKPMSDTQLPRVRGVQGVEWAVPFYHGILNARTASGKVQHVNVNGLDDATLIGAPPEMVVGSITDLRRADSIIVDETGASRELAHPPAQPGGVRAPLAVGETLEINDHRATVVGICRTVRSFQWGPQVYTTHSRAVSFAPPQRKSLCFVLVKAKAGEDIPALCQRLRATTGLEARTHEDFKNAIYDYFYFYTGIPINFGIAVLLGFIVGTAIAGQTFYNFTLDNLKHFGALKAMGAPNAMLLKMILLQSALVGAIGYGLGVGIASLFGLMIRDSELAFRMPWWLLVVSAVSVAIICMLSAGISILKVVRLEPAIVFKG
jgi:putative ABC transport system permease protein